VNVGRANISGYRPKRVLDKDSSTRSSLASAVWSSKKIRAKNDLLATNEI